MNKYVITGIFCLLVGGVVVNNFYTTTSPIENLKIAGIKDTAMSSIVKIDVNDGNIIANGAQTNLSQEKTSHRPSVDNESISEEQVSQLDRFLAGEIEMEVVLDKNDLYRYLVGKWDGESAHLEDHIYDISIDKIGDDSTFVFITIKNKLMEKYTIEEFKSEELENAINEVETSSEYGLYSSTNELLVVAAVNALNLPIQQLYVHSITCKELKCVFFVDASTKHVFTLFEERIRSTSNVQIQLDKIKGIENFGIFTVYFSIISL